MKRDTLLFVKDIKESVRDIEEFSKELSRESFIKDKLRQNAIIRSLEIIGEAVKNIPVSFRDKHPDVLWKEIAGMRDKLTHHYFGVDLPLVWSVVEEDIPILKKEIEKINTNKI